MSLDGNEVGDEVIKELCQLVTKLGSIEVLNLSKCAITCEGACQIANILENRQLKIKALVLHWNKIRGRGSCQLAKAVKFNTTLLIFDASFNSFGSSAFMKKPVFNQKHRLPPSRVPRYLQQKKVEAPRPVVEALEPFSVSAYKWSRAIIDNKSMVHIDFSFNQFKAEDMRIIGEGLKRNHTVLGFHLMGNEGKVDELGFVIPEKDQDNAVQHVFVRIPRT